MKVEEDDERDDLNVLATMFCFKDEQHYALTCFHIQKTMTSRQFKKVK